MNLIFVEFGCLRLVSCQAKIVNWAHPFVSFLRTRPSGRAIHFKSALLRRLRAFRYYPLRFRHHHVGTTQERVYGYSIENDDKGGVISI